MRFNVKVLISLISVSLLMFSCEKEDEQLPELPVSDPVTSVEVIAGNQKVEVFWVNPSNELYEQSILRYGDQEIELSKDQDSVVLENLINGTEYSIEIVSIDSNGTESEPVVVTATPEPFVTVYEAKDAEDGIYFREESGLRYKVEISGNNLSYIIGTTSHYEWFFEGPVSEENDTSFVFDYVYSADPIFAEREVINEGKDIQTNEFCIELYGETYYVRTALRKISGDASFLPGKYSRFYNRIESDGEEIFNNHYYAEFDEEGNGIFWNDDSQTDDNGETLVTWDNESLLNEDFIFAKYKNEIYLITKSRTTLLKKQ